MSKIVNGKLIEDFKQFKAQWEEKASDPTQCVLFFLIAAYNYAHGDQSKAEAMATVVLYKNFLVKEPKSPSGFKMYPGDRFFLDQIAANPEIVNSYLGGTPENGYKIDVKKLVMNVVDEGFVGDDGTITIQSAGKDLATPCNVSKNEKNQWQLSTIAPIATSVKKAV